MEAVETAYRRMADRYIELFASTTHVHSDDLAFISRHLSIRLEEFSTLVAGQVT